MFFSFILIIIITINLIIFIDKKIVIIFDSYIDEEVKRLITNIVNDSLYKIKYDNNFEVLKDNDIYSYDTNEMNRFVDKLSMIIQEELINLEDGYISKFNISDKFKKGHYKNIKNGMLSEISIGSIRNSTLFANVGPTIPLRLTFVGSVNSKIDVSVREYGINNVIVETYAIIQVDELVTMPITSKRQVIEVKHPISIKIFNGEIPKYYNGFMK